jgi:hypothetical protein
MNEYLYRFKTEEEFIKEFGEDWRHSLGDAFWVDNMNIFFGTDLKYVLDEDYLKVKVNELNKLMYNKLYNNYYITGHMIKLKNSEPTYLPKKLSYE